VRRVVASAEQRVLVVDDDAATGRALAFELQGWPMQVDPHAVVVAGTGEEALRAFSTGRFGLVLVDLGLPDISGIDVIRELRRLGISSAILAYSGVSDGPGFRDALYAGADHVTGLSDLLDGSESVLRTLKTAARRRAVGEVPRASSEVPASPRSPPDDRIAFVTLADVERLYVEWVVQRIGPKPKEVAGCLGLSVRQLRRLARSLGIARDALFRPYQTRRNRARK
jgi:CheY-like chemotaxis protein